MSIWDGLGPENVGSWNLVLELEEIRVEVLGQDAGERAREKQRPCAGRERAREKPRPRARSRERLREKRAGGGGRTRSASMPMETIRFSPVAFPSFLEASLRASTSFREGETISSFFTLSLH